MKRTLAGLAATTAGVAALAAAALTAPGASATPSATTSVANASASITASQNVTPAAVKRARQRAAYSASIVTRVNTLRVSRGLPALTVAEDLTAYATTHSAQMARPHRLAHSTGLAQLCCWRVVGENVAFAASPYKAHVALVHSPKHLANMLDPRYTEVGVGAVSSGGQVWVTEVFRTRAPGR
ncbi:uncharacterized protein YkwD [Motilibacter peucedani]|uniref:Uncharacterized protein YkwD n=1 Tax=Motilibacter peucedani TaxID=598650 RepID=A0A420XJU3_9ACTN|nr:CAP domain-containing protein [Motilibacter peucedani]RKS67903.1 uncharacterized protein YkwD [Motilibacter peucedani]